MPVFRQFLSRLNSFFIGLPSSLRHLSADGHPKAGKAASSLPGPSPPARKGCRRPQWPSTAPSLPVPQVPYFRELSTKGNFLTAAFSPNRVSESSYLKEGAFSGPICRLLSTWPRSMKKMFPFPREFIKTLSYLIKSLPRVGLLKMPPNLFVSERFPDFPVALSHQLNAHHRSAFLSFPSALFHRSGSK